MNFNITDIFDINYHLLNVNVNYHICIIVCLFINSKHMDFASYEIRT